MSTLAFTNVQNEFISLEIWLKYHSKQFDDTFVIGWNLKKEKEPFLKELQKKYGFEYDVLNYYEVNRFYDDNPASFVVMLRDYQQRFLKDHEWVSFTNCDELLIPKKKGVELKDIMKKHPGPYIKSEGYEVIQVEGEEPLDYTKPVLKQRKWWIKNRNYNKIILGKEYMEWMPGMHKLSGMDDSDVHDIKHAPLYLLHLKHIDLSSESWKDIGPYKTNPDPNIMEHWRKRKRLIPEHLKVV